MSASELSQLMREAGLTTTTTTGDKIQVEHVLVITLSEATDKLCRGIVLGTLDLGRKLVECVRILTIAGSVSLLLWGTCRLIESFRRRPSPRGDSDGDRSKQV